MKLLTKQFFGKTTLLSLLAIFVVHILAVFIKDTSFTLPILSLIFALTFFASYKSTRIGILIAFIEVFVGGHGHLIDTMIGTFSLSLRMVIFFAVMSAWGLKFLQGKEKLNFDTLRDAPWLAIIGAIGIGVLIGFVNNPAGIVIDDANVYVSIAYLLPILSIQWNSFKRKMLLQGFAASVIWTVLLTFTLSYVFTHYGANITSQVYTFVRDTRLAEITLQSVSNADGDIIHPWAASILGNEGYWYRVFMPSQFFVAIASLMFLSITLFVWRGKKIFVEWYIAGGAIIATLLFSGSRSFLVGLLAGSAYIVGMYLMREKRRFKDVFVASYRLLVMSVVAIILMLMMIVAPFNGQPSISSAAFYKTSANTTRDMAVTSRWALLSPLTESIMKSPIIGSGFGTTVVYESDDPRIIEETGGVYETYRFEWGYHDIWLKMGILGLLSYMWYFAVIILLSIKQSKTQKSRWIIISLSAGIVALFSTHIFSPYLNHSIGIISMIFIIPFLIEKKEVKSKEKDSKFNKIANLQVLAKQPSTITSSKR